MPSLVMSIDLPDGAQRVQDFLRLKKSEADVRLLPESTATALEAANSLAVELYQIGKSIVFANKTETVVAVVCGDRRVNANLLSKHLNLLDLQQLKADEIRKRTNFVIGGVSPFGLPEGTKIIIDQKLYSLPECFVAAGHPKAVVSTTGKEIVAITNAKILPIC